MENGIPLELQEQIEEMNSRLEGMGIHHGFLLGLGTFDVVPAPNYPYMQEIVRLVKKYKEEMEERSPATSSSQMEIHTAINAWPLRGQWKGYQGTVYVCRDGKGHSYKVIKRRSTAVSRLSMLVKTWKVRTATTLMDAEERARETLHAYLTDEQWNSYMITDMFEEVSKRSGVCYLLRKNRPTFAFRSKDNTVIPLTTLCLHPLAYYTGTWAGGLSPTDDVISHLLLIRGDEHLFWRESNQIPISDIESGI